MIKIIIILLLSIISCKSQVVDGVLPLSESFEYYNSEKGYPKGTRYLKDTKEDLDKFVGIWKGKFEGKTYEFRFEKKEKFGKYTIKRDLLIGRILIKDSNNKVIYNTLDRADDDTYMKGVTFQKNVYFFNFFSINNDYCLDSGVVFIRIENNNPNQISFRFDRDNGIYNAAKCPNFETYETTLPHNKRIVLYKQ